MAQTVPELRRPAYASVVTWTLALVCLGLYVLLWGVMWAPVIVAGNEGWLLLYPVFLLTWVPIELLAIGIVVAVPIVTVRRRGWDWRSISALSVAGTIALLSLPFLWFGIPR